MGTARRDPEDGPHDDPGENKDPDDVQAPVADHAEGNPECGEHAGKQQRRHRGQSGRAQRVVDRQRPDDVEEHDRRQGLQATPVRGR